MEGIYLPNNSALEAFGGAAKVAETIRTDARLKYLDLCDLFSGAVAVIAGALPACTSLENLELTFCDLEQTETAQVLADGIKACRKLKVLKLCDCSLTLTGGKYMLDAVIQNTSIVSVDLSFNIMGFDGYTILCTCIRLSPHLKQLDLSGTRPGELGIAALAAELKCNTSLKVLDLSGCGVIQEGAQSIAKALETNTTLSVLFIRDNDLGDAGIEALARVIRTSPTLRRLDVGLRDISEDVLQLLADAVENSPSRVHISADREINSIVAAETRRNARTAIFTVLASTRNALVQRDGDRAIMNRVLRWMIQ